MAKSLNVSVISNYGKLKHNNILAVDIFQILLRNPINLIKYYLLI